MFKIIGIVAATILGAFAGRIACIIMNREEFTVNPMICTIIGIVGGALGGWLVSAFGFEGGVMSMLLQIAAGVGFAVLFLLIVAIARDKKQEPFLPEDDEDETEDAGTEKN